jgi:hypothetical protein
MKRITTVEVDSEKMKKFKSITALYEITFKSFVNATLNLFNQDKNFRNLIITNCISGSL